MSLFEMKFVVLVEVAFNLWIKGILYVELFVFMDSIDEKPKLPGGNHGLLIFNSQQHATFSKIKNKMWPFPR